MIAVKEERRSNLSLLRDLTKKLTLPDMIECVACGKTKYTTENGNAMFGICYRNTPDVSVMHVYISKDTPFDEHIHESIEYGAIYQGKLEINYEGETKVFSVGEMLRFEPNKPHSGIALEDSWIVFVAIPAAEGYAHDGE